MFSAKMRGVAHGVQEIICIWGVARNTVVTHIATEAKVENGNGNDAVCPVLKSKLPSKQNRFTSARQITATRHD